MSPTPPTFSNLPACKSYVAKLLDENNIEPKKTKLEFVGSELFALLAQVLVFGTAFALSSNFLDDKDKSIKMFSEKVGGGSLSELWTVAFGLLLVLGLLTVFGKAVPAAQAQIDEFMFEIPRAIYAFGASSTAACVCLAIFMRSHPKEAVGASIPDVLEIAVALLVLSFIYGCTLSFIFKKSKLK
jgi:hypothetical protein